MIDSVENLILDLVEWLSRRRRTYQETIDAWRTSCPRLPVWEDAIARGFVEITFADGQSTVTASKAGLDFLSTKGRGVINGLTHMNTINYEACAQNWIAAWNAHDLDRILEHYSEDVELISPFVAKLTDQGDGVVRGKTALRDYFARGLNAFPTLRFDFMRLYPGVRSCVLEYQSVNGLWTAELMEFDDQGKVRRVLAHYREPEKDEHPVVKENLSLRGGI